MHSLSLSLVLSLSLFILKSAFWDAVVWDVNVYLHLQPKDIVHQKTLGWGKGSGGMVTLGLPEEPSISAKVFCVI